MHCFKTDIRERKLFSLSQRGEYLWIEVARRIERIPPRTNDMTEMQSRGRESVSARFVQQICLDRGLLDAIVANGTAWLRLRGGHLNAITVGPDRAVKQVMLYLASQCLHQMLSAFQRKADHINDNIGLEIANLLPKRPVLIFSNTIQRDLADGIPGCVWLVRVALPAANRRHLVPRSNQTRNQIGTYVSGTPNNDNARHDKASNLSI